MSALKKIRTVVAIMMVVTMVMMVMIAGKFILDRQDDYDVDLSGVEVPTYKESTISFDQGNDSSVSLPFLASAIIDFDGVGVEELFVGGG